MKKECLNCKLEKEHHAKGLCYSCYKKLKWQPKIQSCKRCKRQMATHAKGLCAGCYNYIFHLDKNRAYNQRKKNNISLKVYRETIKKCVLCEFNKIIDVHYIDSNKNNNSPKNLIGLCPNHHRMINNPIFRSEIFQNLKEKGFDLPLSENPRFHKKEILD